jgi:hypothetical protein
VVGAPVVVVVVEVVGPAVVAVVDGVVVGAPVVVVVVVVGAAVVVVGPARAALVRAIHVPTAKAIDRFRVIFCSPIFVVRGPLKRETPRPGRVEASRSVTV